MAQGSNRRGGRVGSPPTRDAARRGTILGVVAAGHLLALASLLAHWPAARWQPHDRHGDREALQLDFIRPPPRVAHVPVRTQAHTPKKIVRRAVPFDGRPLPDDRNTVTVTATAATAVAPTGPVQLDYRPGDFAARLRDAQRPSMPRLPGSDASRVAGIHLQAVSSVQKFVHAMTLSTRCSAEQFKMRDSATQFVTAQLMDRALEADGCGAHAETTPAGATVDAITRQLTRQ